MLRPLLSLAVSVAREGEEAEPRVPAPPPLRRLLGFAKLPNSALTVMRRVLDQHDDFRDRVADAASEQGVGRAGWLFVRRPDGWEEELGRLIADADAKRTREMDARSDKNARRRAERAERAARTAESSLADARQQVANAKAQLTAERQSRRAVESEAGRLRKRIARLEEDLAAARQKAADAEAAQAVAHAEREELRRALDRAEAAPPVVERSPAVDVDAIAEALGRASDALDAASRTLGRPLDERVRGDTSAAGGARRSRPRLPRRVPAELPPGIRDDSVEAADAVARVAGMVLLVDGYNVSLRGWGDRPLEEQRQRLVDCLAALAARTGVEPRVVFDGADDAARTVAARPRSTVRLTFSPADVEADDVLLDALDALPVHRPAAVASNDRRVRDEARARGANLLTAEQLLALLRG